MQSSARLAAIAILALGSVAACSDDDADFASPGRAVGGNDGKSVANPAVSGPITGGRGHPLWDSWYDLGELGYVEEEYFVSGSAKTYPATTPADYTTRVIVRRPADPRHFNGTVLLDWVNVTAQFENAVDSVESHEYFQRAGFAYVHVSAQAAGICCLPLLTPKMSDAERYAPLNHPGDDYSFDMFSQIAKAFKAPGARDGSVDMMDGLRVERIIAMGQSQSGTRLHDYLTKVQADARVIDGFLVHADGAGNKTYPADPAVPTIQLLSEREASPGEPNVRGNYRLWEVAGGAHQDFWIGYHQVIGARDRAVLDAPQQPASADAELHQAAANYGEQIDPLSLACVVAGTQFPMRYLVSAAIDHLDRWIRGGAPPPTAPRYAFDGSGQLARDQYGNALGGIRLPPIELPVARYDSARCNLGGITIPFTELELQLLYPTHADYYCAMQAAAQRSVADGFLLTEDAEELLGRADQARNRWLSAGIRNCAERPAKHP